MHCKLLTSSGINGKEISEDVRPIQAYDRLQRQIRLRSINALPVTVDIRCIGTSPSWKITEPGALYWLELQGLVKFLAANVESLKIHGRKGIDTDALDAVAANLNGNRGSILQGNLTKVKKQLNTLQSLELKLMK